MTASCQLSLLTYFRKQTHIYCSATAHRFSLFHDSWIVMKCTDAHPPQVKFAPAPSSLKVQFTKIKINLIKNIVSNFNKGIFYMGLTADMMLFSGVSSPFMQPKDMSAHVILLWFVFHQSFVDFF